MQNLPGLRVNVLLPTEPQYGRFGENVRPKTMYRIEAVVEWVEEHGWTPFTQTQAWRGSGGGSWPTAAKTLLEMRDLGLLRRVNDPKTKPGLWVRCDSPWPNRQVDNGQSASVALSHKRNDRQGDTHGRAAEQERHPRRQGGLDRGP